MESDSGLTWIVIVNLINPDSGLTPLYTDSDSGLNPSDSELIVKHDSEM